MAESDTTERMHVLADDCWCGTTTEPVKRDDGSTGWLIVHHRAAGLPGQPLKGNADG